MQLDDLIKALRRHRVVAGLTLLVILGLGVLAAFIPEERYASSATVLVIPNLEEAGALQVVASVMPTMETRINSRVFGDGAYTRLAEHRGADVDVDVIVDPEAGVIDIRATGTDPEATAAWANAWAAHVVENPPATTLVLVESLDPAIPATVPYTPVRPPVLFASGVLALIGALFTPLAADWLQRRREGPRALIEKSGVTVLGEIPDVRKRFAPGSTSVAATVGFGPPQVVEAFQSLRTNLEIVLVSAGWDSIAVTSTRPSEGKSTVAAHVGWALASVGHQVVVVDADLRRPTLHQLFDAPLEPGLSDAARVDSRALMQDVGLPGLTLVPAGVPERHPAEVMRDNLPRLVEQIEEKERLVLIDSPPLAGVAESSMIVTMARRVILVVDARTDEAEVERSLLRIRELGAEVLGVVVNRSRRRRESKVDYFFDKSRASSRRPAGPSDASLRDLEPIDRPRPRTGIVPDPGRPPGATRAAEDEVVTGPMARVGAATDEGDGYIRPLDPFAPKRLDGRASNGERRPTTPNEH
jgi:capsular exopolysaccharide synthesis family protein